MKRKFTQNLLRIIIFSLGFIMNPEKLNAQTCAAPTGIITTNVSNFTATLNWFIDNNVDHYRIRYKVLGATIWINNNNILNNYRVINNLISGTSYSWQVMAYCNNSSTSSWSVADTFMTTNYALDCNNTPNGTAFTDSCGNCVGGTTSQSPCISFSPTATILLSTSECNTISDITFTTSQDPNEPDMSSVVFSSDGGYFDFTGLVTNDTIGSCVMTAGGGFINISTTLMVDFIISPIKISVKAIDSSSGQIYGAFTIENPTTGGILVVATSPPDSNNVTSGNSQIILLNGLFVNPSPSILTFTSTINSELGDIDNQTTTKTIGCTDCNGDFGGIAFIDSCGNCVGGNTGDVSCIPFSPTVSVSLSNTDCDSLTDLTINVSQDPNEPDMATSLFSSNNGSFAISTMSVGNVVGSAVMSANGGTINFNANLIVTSIISINQAIIQSQDINTGLVLGTFTISNTSPGINIIAQSPPDGNNVTAGNSQTVTFNNIFLNPGQGTILFTTTINSEVGDVDVQAFPFTIVCIQACPQLGDANCDGIVNLADLTLVLNNWLQSTAVGQDGDVVGSLDGFVNLNDLTLVLNNWLQSTP